MARRHPYNPLAPLSQKQLNQMAQRYAQAQYGPVLSQINKDYAQRAQAGASAIAGSTNQLAQALAPIAGQTHAIYGQAQQAQAGLDTGLANRLTAAGIAAQSDVGGQLAAAGQAPSPVNLGQIGAGAGAASYGLGSAALSRLVAEGAARENYGAQLPGIARLAGAQRGQDLALQLESGRQKDVGDLRSKIPGTVAQIQQDLQNREFQKAAANLSYSGNTAALQQKYDALNEQRRSHTLTYKAKMKAITAANTRSGMTLKERARHNQVSEDEQSKRDLIHQRQTAQRLKQQRRQQWYREHHPSGSGGDGRPSKKKLG